MDDFPCSFCVSFISIACASVSVLLNVSSLTCLLCAAIINVLLLNKVYLLASWKLSLQFTFSVPLKYSNIFHTVKSRDH